MDSSVHCTFFQSSKVQSLCCCVHFSLFNLFFFSNIVFLTDSLLLRPSERSLLLTLITDTEGLHVESQFGGYLFAHSWGPYQVLPPRSGWAWEQQHLRGRPMCLKTSRSEALLPEVVYRHTQDAALFFFWVGGYPSAEVQSTYFTAASDSAIHCSDSITSGASARVTGLVRHDRMIRFLK